MKLTLDNVRKEYADTVALGGRQAEIAGTGVSFEVDDGEFFTLVGPSGCGKTTTLRLVAGFDAPTSGTIRFDGDAMGGVPPEERGVGVVFQNYALFPHLSVAENVGYGLRFAEPPDGTTREERVASLLDLVDLPDAGDRDPAELSGGQQQRVALARALAPGPELLLLDEPMSALDARLRERLRMQIKEIQSTLGITTLYVTHDQEEALAVSDRVAVMNDGTVEQIATPQTIYRRPESRFVADFVGDNNVFEGEVTAVRTPERPKYSDSASDESESPVETKGFGFGEERRESGGETGVEASASTDSEILTVDVDGADIRVRTATSVNVGDRVVCCVRPEQMRVRDSVQDSGVGSDADADTDDSWPGSPAPHDAPNVLTATVVDSEFLGESTRTHLRWNGRDLTAQSTDPLDGDVDLAFDPADVHLVEVRERRQQ